MNASIKRAIEDLSELAELLSDEIVEQTFDQQLTPRGKACKEALQTAGVFSEKLHKVMQTTSAASRQMEFGVCESCDLYD